MSEVSKPRGFDVIGDVHGRADALERLLGRLGYVERDGVYAHPDRVAFFVGDFIDRGPQSRRVVEIVRAMVEAGAARAIMGNHEYNAICYHTPDPNRPREYLRPHNDKDRAQHAFRSLINPTWIVAYIRIITVKHCLEPFRL